MKANPELLARIPVLNAAILIDVGWLSDWPHEWTKDGVRGWRRNKDWDRFMAEARRYLIALKGPEAIKDKGNG